MALQTNSNIEMITRYTDQPVRMPNDVRKQIETLWKGEKIQLYAMADLDDSMKFVCKWIALGSSKIAIIEPSNNCGDVNINIFQRSQVKAIWETPGLSCTILTLLADNNQPALATLRYTNRQRKAMENIKFILQQKVDADEVQQHQPDKIYAEAIAQPIKEAQASVSVHRLKVIWRLLAYLMPYKKQLLLGMVAAVLLTIVSLFPPYITGFLIDRIIKPTQSGQLDVEKAIRMAILVVSGIAMVYILRELFAWVRMRTMAILGEYVARNLRTELYEHLQNLSLSYFSAKQTGGIIARVSSDTDRLWHFIAFGIVQTFLAIIMLIGLGIVLLCLDLQLGLIMTLPMPILLWILMGRSKRMQKIFLKAWRKWTHVTAVLGDTIPGMRIVKAFNKEDYEKKRFEDRNIDATEEFNRIHVTWTKFWPRLMLALHVMVIAVWVFAVPRLLGSETSFAGSLSIGKFISFLLYMGMFVMPIEMIGQAVQMMNRATSSAHRIFEILDTEPQITNVDAPILLEPLEGKIKFENVAFGYDGIRPIIKGISFEVAPGEMIGLVGPSGAGKTTIINLIARFYDVTSGRILIDDTDLRRLEIGHYRQQIGMVLQDPFLFHGPILKNIKYSKQEATVEEVITAAKAANAHDFICKLPYGYDTIVGERGHTLSGGERQRVSIARAILNNPKILILDEATSSVDTETERKIQQALDRLIKGRTVFAIAHRLSTLNKANRLIVIEDGHITEIGTHKELLSNPNGTYTKLCKMQQKLHKMYAV